LFAAPPILPELTDTCLCRLVLERLCCNGAAFMQAHCSVEIKAAIFTREAAGSTNGYTESESTASIRRRVSDVAQSAAIPDPVLIGTPDGRLGRPRCLNSSGPCRSTTTLLVVRSAVAVAKEPKFYHRTVPGNNAHCHRGMPHACLSSRATSPAESALTDV
jgi:hypothetical protein